MPKSIMRLYHYVLAWVSVLLCGDPSSKLFVIGVTGTNGKSSTVQMIAQMLESLDYRIGYTTTAGFSVAGYFQENILKMTMPGRLFLQRMLRAMVRAGCTHAIIETSSQGIEQFRHTGINYDLVTYTNLTPEHLEAHGGFEAYKQAKGRLFAHLTRRGRKELHGKQVKKISVINADDEHAPYFLSFPADQHVTYSHFGNPQKDHVVMKLGKVDACGRGITVNGEQMHIPYLATFEQSNAISALAVLVAMGIELPKLKKALCALEPIAGRFERIDEGQDFHVIVDYAYEPFALLALFEATHILKPKRIIGVHGSAGGGRDRARRKKIGTLASEYEDIVIVTNEDPYDEDPRVIMEEVAQGAREGGKQDGVNLFVIEDREVAIEKAIHVARSGDAVLITGKGSETIMAVGGGKTVPMDDRQSARNALHKRALV